MSAAAKDERGFSVTDRSEVQARAPDSGMQQQSWEKPDPSSGTPDTGILKMYYGSPKGVKNYKTSKEEIVNILELENQDYDEFKKLIAFLFTHHQSLLQIRSVNTRNAKNTVCDVSNQFLRFLSPQCTSGLSKPTEVYDISSHTRGWLIFQLALFVKRDVVEQWKRVPEWKGSIPESLKRALVDGTFPDITSFDGDSLLDRLRQDYPEPRTPGYESSLISIDASSVITDTDDDSDIGQMDEVPIDESPGSSQETAILQTRSTGDGSVDIVEDDSDDPLSATTDQPDITDSQDRAGPTLRDILYVVVPLGIVVFAITASSTRDADRGGET
ncbi:hypothetical protein TWF281_006621 [Arthrobotrys megalospora]